MALPMPLLSLLLDGKSHSGEFLGEALGVSRAAIWKQIKALRDAGMVVEAIGGEGYRLPLPMQLVDVAGLQAVLGEGVELLYAPLMASTNQCLRERAEQEGFAHPVVALAECQSAGRGRRGRHWQAGFARSLLLSLGMRLDCAAAELGGLSLACGVAVAEAVETCGIAGVQLKWPNDLLLDGGKLGGILIEVLGEAEGPCDVIVGLGLNVDECPEVPGQAVSCLRDNAVVERNALLQAIAPGLLGVLGDYAREGLAPWREAWQQRHAYADAPVQLLQGERVIDGTCRGIDRQGALVLETGQGVQHCYSGEISLRPR